MHQHLLAIVGQGELGAFNIGHGKARAARRRRDNSIRPHFSRLSLYSKVALPPRVLFPADRWIYAPFRPPADAWRAAACETPGRRPPPRRPAPAESADRKSVGWGKGVLVHENLGWCRK